MGLEIRTKAKPTAIRDFPLVIIDLQKLVPHEMTIEHALEQFKIAVVADGMIKHPIVIDSESNLILDGHHRQAGLLALGFTHGPAIKINYLDDNLVTLDTWYPKLKIPPEIVLENLKQSGFTIKPQPVSLSKLSKVQSRSITAIIGNSSIQWEIEGERERIFQLIRNLWLKSIVYYDDPIICIDDAAEDETAIISWSYTKQEILEHVRNGLIHLPKTTRHTLHYLYKDCNYPLSKLSR